MSLEQQLGNAQRQAATIIWHMIPKEENEDRKMALEYAYSALSKLANWNLG